MALTERLKQGFIRLPLMKKVILLSSAGLMVSGVLPWYDKQSGFGGGEAYLGMQGPMFLVGSMVIAFGAVSFFNLFLPLMGRNFFRLKRKSGLVAMALGVQSLLLILVANSVYYHPDFGVNVTSKTTRFGMLVAFGSIALMVISGYLTHRKEKASEGEDIDEVMTNVEAEPVSTVRPLTAVNPAPERVVEPAAPTSRYQRPPGAYEGDPLLLDPKERYKRMRSQMRRQASSQGGQGNYWGGQVTDNMKIRVDL